MASLNSAQLIGNLGNDPEVRKTNSGQDVANFSVATKESYVKDGQKVDHTEWHKVIAWGKTATLCAQYLKKGSSVYLQGKLQTRKWVNKQGQDQYTTEIIAHGIQFLDRKQKIEDQGFTQKSEQPQSHVLDDFDLGEIPF